MFGHNRNKPTSLLLATVFIRNEELTAQARATDKTDHGIIRAPCHRCLALKPKNTAGPMYATTVLGMSARHGTVVQFCVVPDCNKVKQYDTADGDSPTIPSSTEMSGYRVGAPRNHIAIARSRSLPYRCFPFPHTVYRIPASRRPNTVYPWSYPEN